MKDLPIQEIKYGTLAFRCNICGSSCCSPMSSLSRETASCNTCGSTVRMRGIVHSLSMALFGESLSIDDFPLRKDIVGIGMSDWEPYAERLTEKLSYKNTFYHKDPLLDICSITSADEERNLDFVISTDVFEHVAPPVSRAFENTYKILKPGGHFIFSVPYSLESKTKEHYPELFDWKVEKRDEWVLINKTRSGEVHEHTGLVFHGGEGETLEMRVFCESALLEELSKAGFEEIKIMKEPCFEHGIYWPSLWSLPILARKNA